MQTKQKTNWLKMYLILLCNMLGLAKQGNNKLDQSEYF